MNSTLNADFNGYIGIMHKCSYCPEPQTNIYIDTDSHWVLYCTHVIGVVLCIGLGQCECTIMNTQNSTWQMLLQRTELCRLVVHPHCPTPRPRLTDIHKMTAESNENLCWYLSLCSMNTSTQFFKSHFILASVSVSVSGNVNIS